MNVRCLPDRLLLTEVPDRARFRLRVVPGAQTLALHFEAGRPPRPSGPPSHVVYGSGPTHPDPRSTAFELGVSPELPEGEVSVFVVDARGAAQSPDALGPPEVVVEPTG